MLETNLTLINPLGLHFRAASELVGVTKKFASSVAITHQDQTIDGKSIMDLLLLGAEVGQELHLVVEGEDEEAAFAAICELVQAGFNELED